MPVLADAASQLALTVPGAEGDRRRKPQLMKCLVGRENDCEAPYECGVHRLESQSVQTLTMVVDGQ